MTETLKIVLPMAGFGTRLRPQTWSRPKQLLTLADNTVLGHLLAMFQTLPDPDNVELIFIVGYLSEKIEAYMKEHFPDQKAHFVLQEEMKGQSHAIHQAKHLLTGGPMLMVFADTLVESNLSFLRSEEADAVAWVKAVPDPRRFGVAEAGEDGWVTRLIEKPESLDNNLVVVGFYYFSDCLQLIQAIETQMERGISLKNEYFLADAVNIMLDQGLKMRTETVGVWLDAGIPAKMIETNAYLLDHGSDNSAEAGSTGATVLPPVYIHPSARIKNSVIGPHASIGADCQISGSVIQNSIVESGAVIEQSMLKESLVGERARVNGVTGIINLGDDCAISV